MLVRDTNNLPTEACSLVVLPSWCAGHEHEGPAEPQKSEHEHEVPSSASDHKHEATVSGSTSSSYFPSSRPCRAIIGVGSIVIVVKKGGKWHVEQKCNE